jgi:hypothetical protein
MITSGGLQLVYEDARLNSWRWRPLIDKWGYLPVFFNPAHLKTTAFLIEDGSPASTCFFVRASLNSRDDIRRPDLFGSAYYAVTAWHCVHGPDVSIRFRLKGGGFEDKLVLATDWIPHGKTDLSILPINFPLDRYDLEWIKAHEIVEGDDYLLTHKRDENEPIRAFRYGVGDEVFSIGLFTGPQGELIKGGEAQPVARFGHIALKPESGETILAKVGDLGNVELNAFLVEIAAWKGQSGSPLFYRMEVSEKRDGRLHLHQEINFVVGMIQGFYPGEERVKVGNGTANIPVNMGIAVVIPAGEISEMLMREVFVKDRQRKHKEHQERKTLQPESASVKKLAGDAAPGVITHERFEEALRRASRKTSTPEDESKR